MTRTETRYPHKRELATEPAAAKKPDTRDYSYDCLRIFAAVLVVVIHVSAAAFKTEPTSPYWFAGNMYDQTAHIAVPLFFMISGALFLSRPKLDLHRFITKNLLTIVLIYVVWTLFYAVMMTTSDFTDFAVFATAEGWQTFALKFASSKFHLWYLRALIMLYLLLPIVHAAIYKTGLSAKYCLVAILLVAAPQIILNSTVGLPEFVRTFFDSFHMGYLAYFLYLPLGYWLAQSKRLQSIPAIALLAACVVVMAGSVMLNASYSLEMGKAQAWLYDNVAVNIIIEASLVFLLFRKLGVARAGKWKFGGAIKYVSGLTLGIYLIHPVFIQLLANYGLSAVSFNTYLAVPVVTLAVFVLSALVAAILRLIPGIKKIV